MEVLDMFAERSGRSVIAYFPLAVLGTSEVVRNLLIDYINFRHYGGEGNLGIVYSKVCTYFSEAEEEYSTLLARASRSDKIRVINPYKDWKTVSKAETENAFECDTSVANVHFGSFYPCIEAKTYKFLNDVYGSFTMSFNTQIFAGLNVIYGDGVYTKDGKFYRAIDIPSTQTRLFSEVVIREEPYFWGGEK